MPRNNWKDRAMSESKDVTVPKGAKKPADRKPKAEKPAVETVDDGLRFTHKGFSVTVANDVFDDFELLRDIGAIDHKGQLSRAPGILERVLGDSQFDLVMDGLRDPETGRVTHQVALDYIQALFEAIAPNS